MLAQLFRARLPQQLHVIFAAKMETSGRARLDARRFKPLAHAIRAQRAFINPLGLFIELRNIERAAGDAISASDAFILLKIEDAMGVLDNRAVSRTSLQTTRFGTVHALILAHQPHQGAVFSFMLVE